MTRPCIAERAAHEQRYGLESNIFSTHDMVEVHPDLTHAILVASIITATQVNQLANVQCETHCLVYSEHAGSARCSSNMMFHKGKLFICQPCRPLAQLLVARTRNLCSGESNANKTYNGTTDRGTDKAVGLLLLSLHPRRYRLSHCDAAQIFILCK